MDLPDFIEALKNKPKGVFTMKKTNVFILGLLVVLLAMSLIFVGCGDDPIKNPDPPQGVTATSDSTSSITVTWGSVSGASGYKIYRSKALSEVFNNIGSSTSTVYTDTGLSPGTTYYYRVSTSTKNGEGSQSSHTSATTKFNAPTGVTAMAASEKSITVSWSAVSSNATIYYYIYRSDSSSGTYTQVGNSTGTSYTDNGLSPNTTYYYKVAVSNGVVTSSQSSPVSATTTPGVTAPTGVTATAASSSSITVRWNAVQNATSYYIYRSNSFSGTYTKVGTSRETLYTDNELSSNTTYFYKVTAYNSNGESSESSTTYASTNK